MTSAPLQLDFVDSSRGLSKAGFVVLVLSRGRLRHPPVLDAYRPLPPSRRWLAWAILVLFILTFVPVPFPS